MALFLLQRLRVRRCIMLFALFLSSAENSDCIKTNIIIWSTQCSFRPYHEQTNCQQHKIEENLDIFVPDKNRQLLLYCNRRRFLLRHYRLNICAPILWRPKFKMLAGEDSLLNKLEQLEFLGIKIVDQYFRPMSRPEKWLTCR